VIGFETDFRSSRPRPRAFWAVALLCLCLLALLATVQVAHMHPLVNDADHCPLCIAMHSAAPVAALAAIVVMITIGTSAPMIESRVAVRYWHPQLFTRPPPAGR